MRKDQRRELQRLEEALLESETWNKETEEPEEADTDQWLEEYYEKPSVHCDVYNTDTTDVDLDTFSEEVHQGRQRGGCLVPLILFLTAVLCTLIGWVLWKQGVIPWA